MFGVSKVLVLVIVQGANNGIPNPLPVFGCKADLLDR